MTWADEWCGGDPSFIVFYVTADRHDELASAERVTLGDEQFRLVLDAVEWRELDESMWALKARLVDSAGEPPTLAAPRLTGLLGVHA